MFVQSDINPSTYNKIVRFIVVTLSCLFAATYGYAETINYKSGAKYEGDLLDGKPHGYGIHTWPDGEKYIGEFKNDSYEGMGTYIYTDGSKYIGEFRDGLFHGQAVYIFSNGGKFTGEYKNDRQWSGTRYLVDGTVHGRYIDGVYRREDTTCMRERRFTVGGKSMVDCVYSENERYIGGFENDKYEGYGTNFSIGGSLYIGEYRNSVINGEGISHHNDGSMYIGHFRNNAYHGRGVYIYSDGSNYIGEFKDKLLHGHGVFVYVSGGKFIGEFKHDMEWNGITYHPDGTVEGTFSNGELIPK